MRFIIGFPHPDEFCVAHRLTFINKGSTAGCPMRTSLSWGKGDRAILELVCIILTDRIQKLFWSSRHSELLKEFFRHKLFQNRHTFV